MKLWMMPSTLLLRIARQIGVIQILRKSPQIPMLMTKTSRDTSTFGSSKSAKMPSEGLLTTHKPMSRHKVRLERSSFHLLKSRVLKQPSTKLTQPHHSRPIQTGQNCTTPTESPQLQWRWNRGFSDSWVRLFGTQSSKQTPPAKYQRGSTRKPGRPALRTFPRAPTTNKHKELPSLWPKTSCRLLHLKTYRSRTLWTLRTCSFWRPPCLSPHAI